MDDVERAVDDGVNSYKALTRDGRFVPGAGATEIELAKQISSFGKVRNPEVVLLLLLFVCLTGQVRKMRPGSRQCDWKSKRFMAANGCFMSINQTINRSIVRSINESINQWINQSIKVTHSRFSFWQPTSVSSRQKELSLVVSWRFRIKVSFRLCCLQSDDEDALDSRVVLVMG